MQDASIVDVWPVPEQVDFGQDSADSEMQSESNESISQHWS